INVVDELRAGGRPMPTRGARLCTFKEISRQLAGFADTREGAVAEGQPDEPTLRGLRLAQEHGISVPGFDPSTPIKRRDTGGQPASAGARAAEAAGVAANKPASAGKPAGDAPQPQRRSLKEAQS